jgi:hypothetical protein
MRDRDNRWMTRDIKKDVEVVEVDATHNFLFFSFL